MNAKLLVLTGLCMLGMTVPAAEPPVPQLIANTRPLVIAHRGYSAFAPENTLAAFGLALKAGADLVELDYYHSKDGVPVVQHDGALDRTTDATNVWGTTNISITSKTVAELKTLDAGSWHNGYKGQKIPTLAEALECIQAGGVTLIERKNGKPEVCIQLLKERGWINHLVVQSFDWAYLKAFHDLEPSQVLGALGPTSSLVNGKKPNGRPNELSAEWLDDLALTGARLVVWSKAVSKESVKLAHDRGFKVWVYTIDDAATANQLLDMGVDGIITNNPSVIFKTLALRKS